MESTDSITQEELQHKFHYDPASGKFTWKNPRARVRTGDPVGTDDGNGYLSVRINKKSYRLHRLAWVYVHGVMPKCIDHIDGVRSNNAIDNLREITIPQNNQNQRHSKKKSGGLLGTSRIKESGKWSAKIGVNGKQVHLGSFNTEDEAHQVYLEAKRKYHPFQTIVG